MVNCGCSSRGRNWKMRGFIQRTRHSSKDQKENVNISNVSAPALLQGLKFYHEFFSFSSSIFLMSLSISSWESIPPISFEYTNIFSSLAFKNFFNEVFYIITPLWLEVHVVLNLFILWEAQILGVKAITNCEFSPLFLKFYFAKKGEKLEFFCSSCHVLSSS